MAGILATPTVDDIQVVNAATGSLTVDIEWTGEDNSVDLNQIRTRWIARTDKASQPAPVKATAEGWAESTTIQTQGAFRYIDTIENATSGQMATSGTIEETDEAVTQGAFSNATVWVMSRLEVA